MTFFAPQEAIQVGDRVKYMLKGGMVLNCGETGTVVSICRKPAGYLELDVRWDKEDPRKFYGHRWIVLYSSVKKIL